MKKVLFDTDVLIEYLRGKDEARTYIDNIQDMVFMSSISMAELYIVLPIVQTNLLKS